MTFRIFGELNDIVNPNDLNDISISGVKELKETLCKLYPALRSKTFRVAVNRQFADDNAEINSTDEIALMPPFSGG